MSGFEKGEVVEATVQGYFFKVRVNSRGQHDSSWVTVGTELVVTAVLPGFLNVRHAKAEMGRDVFRVRMSDVRRVRQVGAVPEGAIPPSHPGLDWLWEDAARLAERFGFCAEFDHLTDALGVPGRERTFRITMLNEDGIRIGASVTARSRALAEAKIRERLTASGPLELTASRGQS